MSLNKTLDRLFDEIRREAKRNPEFADRLDAVFQRHDSRRDVPDEAERCRCGRAHAGRRRAEQIKAQQTGRGCAKLSSSNERFYGINTGFGALYNVGISSADLRSLQQNLLMSHACGTGDEVPAEIVRLMLLLKIQSLSYGHSGVQFATVQRLADFFNQRILPVVYEQGSLGASGDLAPLSHLSLPLIGMGEVYFEGKKQSAGKVLQSLGWQPIELQSKEGLALINGTQFMAAYAVWCVEHAHQLSACDDLKRPSLTMLTMHTIHHFIH